MVHAVELVVDGAEVPRDELVVSPDGGADWFTLDEAATVTTYRWEYGTPAARAVAERRPARRRPRGDAAAEDPRGVHPDPFGGGERTRTITL